MQILRSWRPLDVLVTLSSGVVLLLILRVLTSAIGSETVAALFAFDEEGNVVTWYAVVLWLFLVVVFRLMASKYRRERHRQLGRAASALGYLAIFFSIDEAVGLSEKIRLIIADIGMTPTTLDQDQIWLLLYGSLLLVVLAAIAPGLRDLARTSPKCMTGLTLGGVVLIAAGFGLEVVPSIKSLPFEPEFEETLELAAVILMIWGALHGLGKIQVVESDRSDLQATG